MNPSKLIVITGPDGAGKSTLCKKIEAVMNEKYGENTVILTSIWDSLEVGNFDRAQIHRYLSKLTGASRTLFLFHSILNGLALAEAKKPKVILADGYFYKYAVSERGYGVDPAIIRSATLAFPKPDLVMELLVSPETAWTRKISASSYEQGGGGENDQTKFIEFQKKNRKIWSETKIEYGPWDSLTEGASIDVLVEKAVAKIEKVIS